MKEITNFRLDREAERLVYDNQPRQRNHIYEWKVADIIKVVRAAILRGIEIGVEEDAL